MTSAASRPAPSSGSERRRRAAAALLLALLLAAGAAVATAGQVAAARDAADGPRLAEGAPADVHAWRAARRRAVADRCRTAKDGGGAATFALLVIPADFDDARFPDPAAARDELARRLGGDAPGTLRHYFRTASGGRLDLRIVLAPVAHLAGTRRDYSDVDLHGYGHSRDLARQALECALAAGLDLRLADDDGPDGRPASGDDDGRADGVLVLHAAAGLENDPDDGWITPLQYVLAVPVVDRGVRAAAYAVAATRSGVGVWAHEVGHLLGLEDRYDPFLPAAAGDAAGRGGLGRFSLMAAGALGSGHGNDPALPDPYSALALGWLEAVDLVRPAAAAETLAWREDTGRVWRLSCPGGDEYFLVEARGGATPPYDAAVPRGLVVYHVDPAVPEGWQSSSDPDTRHLRVRLVEADADGALAAGLDTGGPADVFPGDLDRTRWGPDTDPSSDGYGGPSGIVLDGVAAVAQGIVATVTAPGDPFAWTGTFVAAPGETTLSFTVTSSLPLATPPFLRVAPLDPQSAWGRFATPDGSVAVTLAPAAAGGWTLPEPVRWHPDPAPLAGATTLFRVTLTHPALPGDQQDTWLWQWRNPPDPLRLDGDWRDRWQAVVTGDPGTTWQRWTVPADHPALPAGPLLACTGTAAADAGDWPGVTYTNGAGTDLLSLPVCGEEHWIRLRHWVDTDSLRGPDGADGAAVAIVTGDGRRVPLVPAGGYPVRLDPRTGHALAGERAWAGPGPRDAAGRPLWREDVLPLPETVTGWCRLQLRFASDAAWRGRGWLVRSVELVPPGTVPFRLRHAAGTWSAAWTAADTCRGIVIEGSPDGLTGWQPLTAGAAGGTDLSDARTASLGDAARWLRAVAELSWGSVATPPVPASPLPDDRPPLRLAARPGDGTVRFAVEVPAAARLEVFDLRGRRLWDHAFVAGTYLEVWPGRDAAGRRLGSGLYLARLRSGGREARCRFLLVR